MLKRENIQMIHKTIQCNNHGGMIRYKCEHLGCQYPFLCADTDCLEEHFHQQSRLVISRFDSKLWQSKFQQVQKIANSNSIETKQEEIAKIIDFFTDSLQKIRNDMTQFEKIKYSLYESSQKRLNLRYFQQLDGFLCLGGKIQRNLDHLRAKISDQDIFNFQESKNIQKQREFLRNIIPQNDFLNASPPLKNHQNLQKIDIDQSSPNHSQQNNRRYDYNPQVLLVNLQNEQSNKFDYSRNKDLTTFLRKYIKNFSWQQSEVVFSSKTPLTSCQKFHQKLKGKSNLLFLFFGNKIIGSYYTQPYPTIAQKVKKDIQSFIFLEDNDTTDKFIHFSADPQSQYHISISDKLLICHGNTPNSGDGLRTFQRNFESIAYFLPSHSFHSRVPNQETTYSDVLKIRDFYIVQIKQIGTI